MRLIDPGHSTQPSSAKGQGWQAAREERDIASPSTGENSTLPGSVNASVLQNLQQQLPVWLLFAALAGFQFAHYQAIDLLLVCAAIGLCAVSFSLAALNREWLGNREFIFLFVVVVFFLSCLVSYALHPGELAAYRVKRYALMAFSGIGTLFFIKKFIPQGLQARHFALALIVSGIITGPLALYLFYQDGSDWRVSIGPNYPTIFGDIACLNTLMCFYLALKERHSRRLRLALYLGAAGALMAVYASGTRGAWLGLLAIIPVIVVMQPHLSVARKLGLLLLVAGAAVASYFYSFYVGERITLLLEELANYYSDDAVVTSSGLRLEFWRASILTWRESPWFGIGDHDLKVAFAALIEDGVISEAVAPFVHVHNDFLQLAYSRGVPGVLLFIALIALPVLVAAPAWRPLAVVVALAYLVFGATDCLFIIEMSISYYFLLAVILLNLRAPSPACPPLNAA